MPLSHYINVLPWIIVWYFWVHLTTHFFLKSMQTLDRFMKEHWHDIAYYNTRSIQKSPVRQQNACSTQKSPVGHKNARLDTKMPSPACISWQCHYQTSPLLWDIFFPISFQYFVFKNPWRNENEIILIWIQIYQISLWKLKCHYSFLFMMTTMSAAINKCYRYGRMFCQFLHFLLIAPLISETHV